MQLMLRRFGDGLRLLGEMDGEGEILDLLLSWPDASLGRDGDGRGCVVAVDRK